MSILGTALPAANTLVSLYEVPAGRRAVVNVAACNQGAAAAKLRVALTASATPAASEFIEFDVSLAASEVLERTALSLAAGQKIVVQANAATVSFNAWGIEEVA
jgi:hypothetical protein